MRKSVHSRVGVTGVHGDNIVLFEPPIERIPAERVTVLDGLVLGLGVASHRLVQHPTVGQHQVELLASSQRPRLRSRPGFHQLAGNAVSGGEVPRVAVVLPRPTTGGRMSTTMTPSAVARTCLSAAVAWPSGIGAGASGVNLMSPVKRVGTCTTTRSGPDLTGPPWQAAGQPTISAEGLWRWRPLPPRRAPVMG